MMDIHFYMKVYDLKRRIMNGETFSKEYVAEQIESCRRKEPVVYNIETTNACNMKCEMCPRTTMMTRKIETLDRETFNTIAEQLKPYSKEEWETWQRFVEEKYGIPRDSMSENHFFLHVIPKVLVLHGYGDPLLDKEMPERVRILNEKGIITYFSCNPANIDIGRHRNLYENGLDYIKFSIESVDDFLHKQIRGQSSDFSESFKKICVLLEKKKKNNYKTVIIITMLNLKRENQAREFEKLKEAFKGMDVYIYIKSQDQQWYENKYLGTDSIHWLEFCQFPWSSMTIKSNGEATMCCGDFNNEIILGDTRKESLYDIWNGEKYTRLRKEHFDLKPGIKCTEQCDMKLTGNFV